MSIMDSFIQDITPCFSMSVFNAAFENKEISLDSLSYLNNFIGDCKDFNIRDTGEYVEFIVPDGFLLLRMGHGMWNHIVNNPPQWLKDKL